MTIEQVKQALEAEVITKRGDLDQEVRTGCASDLMSDVLAFSKSGNILLTGLTNPQVIRASEMAEIKVVCFVRGKWPDEKTVELAGDQEVILLTTRLPMFESCGRLYGQGLKSLGALCMQKNHAKK
jgi:hypothetical protein